MTNTQTIRQHSQRVSSKTGVLRCEALACRCLSQVTAGRPNVGGLVHYAVPYHHAGTPVPVPVPERGSLTNKTHNAQLLKLYAGMDTCV